MTTHQKLPFSTPEEILAAQEAGAEFAFDRLDGTGPHPTRLERSFSFDGDYVFCAHEDESEDDAWVFAPNGSRDPKWPECRLIMTKPAWIPWGGGERNEPPVPKDVWVEVKFLDGDAYDDLAGEWWWDHTGSPGDIIAYRRILSPQQQMPEAATQGIQTQAAPERACESAAVDPNRGMLDRDAQGAGESGSRAMLAVAADPVSSVREETHRPTNLLRIADLDDLRKLWGAME